MLTLILILYKVEDDDRMSVRMNISIRVSLKANYNANIMSFVVVSKEPAMIDNYDTWARCIKPNIDGTFAINGNYHGNRAQQPIKIKVPW